MVFIAYNCPYDVAGKDESGQLLMCELRGLNDTYAGSSSCPAGHFCFAHLQTKSSDGRPMGHCCPTPPAGSTVESVCPVGNELPNSFCPEPRVLSENSSFTFDQIRTCPLTSHTCSLNLHMPRMVCCPLPCRSDVEIFNIQGKCHQPLMDGSACEYNAQCQETSICTNDSSCTQSSNSNEKYNSKLILLKFFS